MKIITLTIGLLLGATTGSAASQPETVAAQREEVLRLLRVEHQLADDELAAVEQVFSGSTVLGQGNPAVTRPAMSTAECEQRRSAAGLQARSPEFEAICGAPYMAPLHDPTREQPDQAAVCIDQYEFPNVPCTYPVVWVKASEAAAICQAMGKRICDAHEWEGACAGRLGPPDYRFDLAAGKPAADAVRAMRAAHNSVHAPTKSWSYGPEYQQGVCAAASRKSADCSGGDWRACGSNTYPSGAFPLCTSKLGVFDLHGNAAEHMNLPLAPDQAASAGGALGVTEMKGSWFIFDAYRAHEDWCRWRAPFWHGTTVRSPASHHNYHLGFRCCKDVGDDGAPAAATRSEKE